MADWNDILTTEYAVDAPITAYLGARYSDNPIAIAEGAVGAPRVMSAAMNIYLGDGSATANVGGSTSTDLFEVLDLDLVKLVFVSARVAGISATGESSISTVRYALSSNNGASYGGYTTIITETNAASSSETNDSAPVVIDMTGFNALKINHLGTLTAGSVSASGSAVAFGIQGDV